MQIVLAPMEGVVDHIMRDMLTQIGGFDLCVTEFVRVVDLLLPAKVFYRLCPELLHQGKTPSGVPVKVQLLGQEPQCLAENAARAIELGSHGVDLNFGCPAKMVNKHKGGAALLKETAALYNIVSAVRAAVPNVQPVTAKIRLGYEDKSLAIDNALAIEAAGASQLVVHARTKVEGYKPPAYWDWIDKIRQQVKIPVIANGEIWNLADAQRCQRESGCDDLMLGRGVLSLPNLALVVRQQQAPMPWLQLQQQLAEYSGYDAFAEHNSYFPNRIKQWLRYLSRQYPQAQTMFAKIRTLKCAAEIRQILDQRLESH